jgi:hypothetical protein
VRSKNHRFPLRAPKTREAVERSVLRPLRALESRAAVEEQQTRAN